MNTITLCVASLFTFTATVAVAETEAPVTPDDIDVAAFEYVDVIEKTDGSVLRGVVIEQEPGVKYKLATADGSLHVIAAADLVKMSKARNKLYRGRPTATATAAEAEGTAVGATYEPPRKRFMQSGVRLDTDVALLFPVYRTNGIAPSVAPTVRAGYEKMIGPLGISAGGQGRFTYWTTEGRDFGAAGPAVWTIELHAYAKAAFHLGRVAPYFGGSLGPDLSFIWSEEMGGWKNTQGLGLNLTTGIGVAATRALTIDAGVDFHPNTDALYDSNMDLSYLALRVGAQLTL